MKKTTKKWKDRCIKASQAYAKDLQKYEVLHQQIHAIGKVLDDNGYVASEHESAATAIQDVLDRMKQQEAINVNRAVTISRAMRWLGNAESFADPYIQSEMLRDLRIILEDKNPLGRPNPSTGDTPKMVEQHE